MIKGVLLSLNLLLSTLLIGQSNLSDKYKAADELYSQGKYNECVDLSNEILKEVISSEQPEWEANIQILLGDCFYKQKKYSEAEKTYNEGLKTSGIESKAYVYSKLGDCYRKLDENSLSIDNYKAAYAIYLNENDNENCAFLASDIGDAFYSKNKIKSAIEWYKKGADHAGKNGNIKQTVKLLSSIGKLQSNYGDYELSKNTFEMAKQKAETANLSTLAKEIDQNLLLLAENITTKQESATEHEIEQQIEMEEYVEGIENMQALSLKEIEKLSKEKQLVEYKIKAQKDDYENRILNEQLKTLKTQKELELSEVNLARKKAELAEQKAIEKERKVRIIGLTIALGLTLIVVILIYLGYLRKKRTNQQLVAKNKKIELQKIDIEQKSNQIVDSISYAQKIQTSLLPSEKSFFSDLPNSLIFFDPRDKVSGDFFWHFKTKNLIFAAAVDCTGHGVPGAFMSIVCSNILDRVMNETKIIDPGEILEKANELLTEKLKRYSVDEEFIKDGMDLSLICIDENNAVLKFSGARNSAYIVRENQLTELKGIRRSIGRSVFLKEKEKPFTTQTFFLKENDMIYLFSDGFADQKGGIEGRKFYYQPFKELLTEVSILQPENQLKTIKNTFNHWKKGMEQIDDVLVIGVKIKYP